MEKKPPSSKRGKKVKEEFGLALYRCRKCDEIFAGEEIRLDKVVEEFYPRGRIKQWDWTADKREEYERELYRLIGRKGPYKYVDDLPDKYAFHCCSDGEWGIGDCIGVSKMRETEDEAVIK